MMPSYGPPGASRGATIELAVRVGQSPLPRVAYQPGLAPTRSVVGSGGDVQWPLSAPGVELRHAEIAWDGESVWVRDVGSQRGTFVNGVRIGGDWVPVQPGAEIRIGQASIVASAVAMMPAMSSAPMVQAAMSPSPQGPMGRAPQPPMGHGASHLQPAGHGAPSNAFDDDLPTSMVSDGMAMQPSLPKAPSTADTGEAERTVIVSSPFDQAQAQQPMASKPGFGVTDRGAPPPGSVPLPRFGKTVPPSAGLKAPTPPHAPVASDHAEATVAFAVPEDRPAAPPMLNALAAPHIGGMAGPGMLPPTQPPFGAMPVQGIQPGPGMQPAQPSYGPGAPMGGVNPVAMAGTFGPLPSSLSASPNMPGQGGSVPSIFGSIPPAPPVEKVAKPVFTLPKRTLILIGVTLVAALAILMMNPSHPPPAGPRPNPNAATNLPPVPTAPRPNFTPPIPGPPAGATGVLLGATTAPPPPPPPDPHVRRPPDPPAPPIDTVPERIAANTVAQGRLREAIPLYDALAAAHPDMPVYAHIAQILRRRVEAQSQNCTPGSTTQCVPNTTAAPTVVPRATP